MSMLRESTALNVYGELLQRHPSNPLLTAQDWLYPRPGHAQTLADDAL
jgi:hypothetical protein